MNVIEKISNWQKNNQEKYCQIKKMIMVQFAFSVLLYIVLIANQLTTHYDGLWNGNFYVSGVWELSLGRWFLLYIDRLRMCISSEPLTSCMTLFFIIIGNILISDIFGQIGKKTGYIAGMIILSSTTVCNYLSYRYTSPAFGASFLLSILAAWVLVKKYEEKLWLWISAVITAMGLGTYQTNLACTCVILIIVFIKMIIDGEDDKKIFNYTLKSFFALAAGCIVYRLIWVFHLKVLNISPSSYKGADNISIEAMIMSLPDNIIKTYKIFISYFFDNSLKHNIFQRMGLYYIVFGVIIVMLVFKIARVAKENPKNALLITVASAILPMACNVSFFLATEAGGIMMQMTAGMVILLPLILCLITSIGKKEVNVNIKKYNCIQILYIILSVIILYGSVYMVSVDQQTMYEGKNSSETLVREIVTELREKKMLASDKTYFFLGRPSDNPLFKTTEFWDMANAYARYGELWDDRAEVLRRAYDGILRNIGVNITIVPDDIGTVIREREDVKNMSVFPAEGSIKDIDGYIIIKVS